MSGEKCPRACSGCRSGPRPSAPHPDLRTAFADKRCVVAPARGLKAQISLSDVNPNKTLCSCISDDHAGRQAGTAARPPLVCHTVFFSCGPGARINQLTINYVGQCVAG